MKLFLLAAFRTREPSPPFPFTLTPPWLSFIPVPISLPPIPFYFFFSISPLLPCLCLLGLQLPDNILFSGPEWQRSGKMHGGGLLQSRPSPAEHQPPYRSALVQTLRVHEWPSLCSLSQTLQPRHLRLLVGRGPTPNANRKVRDSW